MFNPQSRSNDEEFGSLNINQENLYTEPKESPKQNRQKNDRISIFFAILFVAVMAVSFYRTGTTAKHQITQPTSPISQTTTAHEVAPTGAERKYTMGSEENERTPKILWVLTSVEIDGLRMIESLVVKHLIHVGKKSSFDVRVVNAITAYDWLTPEMTDWVRRTKHKSKYILSVTDLLRVALLIEHGGLSVRLSRYIFPDDLDWLYDMLEQPLQSLLKSQQSAGIEYCENTKDAEIVLFYEKGKGGDRRYEDWVIYARKQSRLLRETFKEMSDLLTAGSWGFKYLVNIEQMEEDVQVKYINHLFIELINFKQFYWFTGASFCQTYQVISINKNAAQFLLKIDSDDTVRTQFMIDKEEFFQKYGRRRMIEADFGALNFNFIQVLQREQLGIAHKNSIFRADIIEVEGNQWLLKPVNKTRDVHFCIVSLKPLPQSYELPLNQSVTRLQEQLYPQWHAVYFANGLTQPHIDVSSNVRVVNSSQYQGLNLQRAAITHCHKEDIALMLDFDESLSNKRDLGIIETEMRNRSIYGLSLSAKHNGIIYKARFFQQRIRRKVMDPNVALLQQIVHNFRVFSVYAYRHIPHMSLHDNSGRYYDRELPLLTLLEMAWDYNRCDEGGMLYHTKRVEQEIEIPKYRKVLPNTFVIMPSLKQIDIKRYEYISKYSARTLCGAMDLYLDRKGRDMRYFFILNNGSQFVGYQDRKQYPQILQKKIHQMWVGKEMPKFKEFLTRKIKENHPDYEYFFWTNDNITRENFPVSYDIITTLLEFNKISRYNKLSMVSDLMRAEIIYNHGGIYLDTNYLVFKKNGLDDWLTFKGMFITQLYPYHRFQREGTVFAAMKGFDRVKRLVDHRSISTRNHYSKQAHIEAGPTFFTATVLGEQELDPDILQPSFEHLYPYYPWDESNHKNLCEVDGNSKQELLFKNKLAYRKDCEDMYPWAIGMDFWNEGKTWA